MNYKILFQRISSLGAEMITAGGSPDAVPAILESILSKYGFAEIILKVSPNFMLSQATDPNGEPITCVSDIILGESNFGKLDALDKYCTQCYQNLPSEEEISCALESINNKNYMPKSKEYIAAVLGGAGFAVMFGCNIYDIVTAIISCLAVVFLGGLIKKANINLFIYNSTISLFVETLILASAKYIGICQHPARITLGVIMLLISGLGVSDGLNSLINKEATFGIAKVNSSLVGALGIAMGIALPLSIIGMEEIEGFVLNENFIIQTLACTTACIGFGMWFCVENKYLPYIAVCSCLCWVAYSLTYSLTEKLFLSTTIATLIEGVAAMLMSNKLKIIPTILLTVSIFPMIPGPNLFYMLYGIVTNDNPLATEQFIEMMLTCLAITMGFSLGALLLNPNKILKRRRENQQ